MTVTWQLDVARHNKVHLGVTRISLARLKGHFFKSGRRPDDEQKVIHTYPMVAADGARDVRHLRNAELKVVLVTVVLVTLLKGR
jgi:hypothetical protein